MDQAQYNTLMDALRHVPDPRKARGKQLTWSLILTLIAAAMATGQRSGRAIAQWVAEHRASLVACLRPAQGRLPSESTLRRALRHLDVAALERQLATYAQQLDQPTDGAFYTTDGQRMQGQAIDGKQLRGARAHGHPTHLVSLVRHGVGTVLAQQAVPNKTNEIRAVPLLLAERRLHGTLTTMDALLTQRAIAELILAQGGHYLMVVKRNQEALFDYLDLTFQIPPIAADQEVWYRYQYTTKGHGRLETRTVECSDALCDTLGWPGVRQVIRGTCERTLVAKQRTTREVSYGLITLAPNQIGPAQIEQVWRAHWTIENRVHYVRDVTWGEDGCQMHIGNAPRVLAGLRNGLLGLFRRKGWENMADAMRHYGASVPRALALIGARPSRL